MKKILIWSILPLIILIVIVLYILNKKDKIDVKDTGFVYEVDVCDEYFELVECIIDKSGNADYTKQMRIDLKNEVKQMQEKWKNYSKEELTKRCTDELSMFYDDKKMVEELKLLRCLE